MANKKYDVAIIGGGVTGSAVARELSRYKLNVCLVEKEEDVCSGTSKANSAIVHAGYDAKPNTLKARLNVEGNRLMEEYSKELDFPFRRNGSLVLCFEEENIPKLKALFERGKENGVPDMQLLTGDEVRRLEPNVTDEVVAAIFAPTGGIVCPFNLTIALAENACDNGVEFKLNTEVTNIEKNSGEYILHTNNGDINTRYIVNAAGVYADKFHNMVCEDKLTIVARKGDYELFDKQAGKIIDKTIFQLPTEMGKGVLVTPTIHGNLLIGPTATDVDNKEGTETTAKELSTVTRLSARSVKNIPYRQVITSFSGLRAHEIGDDFVIDEVADGFFDCAGIESPGLSCAPALGRYVADMVSKKANAELKEDWNGVRKGIIRPLELSMEDRAELIRKRPDYGTIICRCENVSEGEIVDSIHRTLGATSLDGVKRRVRQGMGRCQAGFCTPKTIEILARELGVKAETICKNSKGSEMLVED